MHEPCEVPKPADVTITIDIVDDEIVLRDQNGGAGPDFECHAGSRVRWQGTANVQRWVVGMCSPNNSPFAGRSYFSDTGAGCDQGRVTGNPGATHSFWVFAQSDEDEALFLDPKLVIQTGIRSLTSADLKAYASAIEEMMVQARSFIRMTEEVRSWTLILADSIAVQSGESRTASSG